MISTDIANAVTNPVDAETLATMIAERLDTIAGPLRDGAYAIDAANTVDAASVWRLYVAGDPSPEAPHGISWWLDSPVERGVSSGGWEQLPASEAGAEADILAKELRQQAPVIVADNDGALHCGCGNDPDGDGFEPCDAAGMVDHDLLDAGNDQPVHYVCGGCGTVSGRIL